MFADSYKKILFFKLNWFATYEAAIPWLPALIAVIPFDNLSLSKDKILFVAPLTLNEPLFCKNSHLKYSLVLKNLFNSSLALIKGVLIT